MEAKDLIIVIENAIKEYEEKLKNKKENISNKYILAKLDFIIIDNMQDTLETYNKTLKILQDLQNRIIERNRKYTELI